MYNATASTRWSMLCIWYLFLCITLFSFFESSAIFTDLSFFTVITTGLTKMSSGHFSSLEICLSSISLSNSRSSFSSRWRGRPFCCIGLWFCLNIDFATWFFDFPSRVHKCGYLLYIHLIMFFSVSIVEIELIWLPGDLLGFCCGEIPSFCRTSLPIKLCVLCPTTRILQFWAVHEPECRVMYFWFNVIECRTMFCFPI